MHGHGGMPIYLKALLEGLLLGGLAAHEERPPCLLARRRANRRTPPPTPHLSPTHTLGGWLG